MVLYCPNCGRQTPDDAIICPYCGNKMTTYQTPQYPMHQMQQPKQKGKMKLIIIVAVIIAVILAVLAIYIYVLGNETKPNVAFVKSESADILTVTKVDPATITWEELTITGNCDKTGLTGVIKEGQQITNCRGTLEIIYKPTNKLLGRWYFSGPAPALSVLKRDEATENYLMIASVDPSYLKWGDIKVTATSGTCVKGGTTSEKIGAGETIGCPTHACTVTIVHTSSNTLLGTWEFTAP